MAGLPLGGDWVLQDEFALRSAGFPIEGLDVFGDGDEPARLRAAAADRRFQEAVAWQNPAALQNAVLNVAAGAPARPSRHRGREEIVASYWQRYSAKNDTIGFFGPLAWGRLSADGPPLGVRAGALVARRDVHFEGWAIQALAAALDPGIEVPLGPWPERDLRAALEEHDDAAVRDRGLTALARLEAARATVAAADADGLPTALAALDAVFVDVTGCDPTRNAGRAYGARTLVYLDCMRDLDVTLGPTLVAQIAPALRLVFEAGRWYAGRIAAIGRDVVADALPPGRRGPFGPVAGQVLRTLMTLAPPEIADAGAALQRRVADLLADPDPSTIGDRAAAAFADHGPAWRTAVFHSADVQLAAGSPEAIAAGEMLAVLADIHPGANPLRQGVFGHRHLDPTAADAHFAALVGPALPFLMPPWAPGLGVDARGVPRLPDDTIHISVGPEALAPRGRRTWHARELHIDGEHVVDATGALRVPLFDVFGLPIFVTSVRTFEPFADAPHAPRLQVGRVVVRREMWNAQADAIPGDATALAAWARAQGMPRRVFVKTPMERKPFLLDLDSAVLGRIAARHIRHAAGEDGDRNVRFTEMLPGPGECWLTGPEGGSYAAELRLVAVDRSAVATASSTAVSAMPGTSSSTAPSEAGTQSSPSAA